MADGWLDTSFDLAGKSVWVAGHRGMVGAALTRVLENENCTLLFDDLDLRDQLSVKNWMSAHKPDVVVIAAAKVGGILANQNHPAEFLYDNMMIEANIIHAAHEMGVEKLLFLGSSCIYPRDAAQPISEDALLTAPLEPTNEAYAIAKIAGLKLCESYRAQYGCDFITVMPCNLYGPGDRYDAQGSHVIPALIMKAHQATDVMSVWGSGAPLREFLYVDDLASALIFILKNYSDARPLNIGSGEEISIADLARLVADVVEFKGLVEFDLSRPDGTPRKLLDSSRIRNAGWVPETDLKTGLRAAYTDFKQRQGVRRAA